MSGILETLYELFKTVIFVLVMAFLIRFFVFQPFMVQGISMEPNFHDSQYLIVDRLSYRLSNPHRGDVVVFNAPDQQGVDYIKRVIGLPGEEIKITHNEISIDGKIIDEKYLPEDFQTLINDDPALVIDQKLGANDYFVMGDNRQHSLDSRIFGTIKKPAIVGKSWAILYPFNYFGLVPHPSY